MRLDRERPFGEILGKSPKPGAKFEQDGNYFNGVGDLVGPEKSVAGSASREKSVVNPETSKRPRKETVKDA